MKRFAPTFWRLILLTTLICSLVVIVFKHQAIQDYFRLRNYTAPAAVAQLANDDTMTAKAKHLFYVNHPDITKGTAFTSHCPSGGEKTVVLGCYIGDDGGIYLYDVTDSRLSGVEQVTAAHETLHAAYRRLSTSERMKVDTMLTNYYEHGLTDQRVKDTIADYKKSEPKDVVNEMHSVFGTEVANLPAPLEQYYKQYFTNRTAITNFTAQYQGEFTSREKQITTDDLELGLLKAQITTNENQLNAQKAVLDTQSASLQQERASNQIETYNNSVDAYNSAVNTYNALLTTTKTYICQYNATVASRNAIALEEQQLTQAISADSLPATQ